VFLASVYCSTLKGFYCLLFKFYVIKHRKSLNDLNAFLKIFAFNNYIVKLNSYEILKYIIIRSS